MKKFPLLAFTVCIVSFQVAKPGYPVTDSRSSRPDRQSTTRVQAAVFGTPLSFEVNKG